MQVLNKEKFTHYKTDFGDLYIAGHMSLEVSEVSSSLDAGNFPEHLRGNFALIYSSPTVNCYAVDHFSTIPLFYTDDNVVGTYYIDVRNAIDDLKINDDEQEMIDLHGGYNFGKFTNIQGLFRVEPCTYVWNGVVKRFITLLQRELTEFSATHCQKLFKAAIDRCTGESNTLFLSGGKDSSTLAGCMKHWNYNFNTISLHSPNQQYSEKKIVERLDEFYSIDTQYVEVEYSGKILGQLNERFFNFWIENPFGAKRSAVKRVGLENNVQITGEGGPLVFQHNMPLAYAIQSPSSTIKDYCKILAIDTITNHKIASPNDSYIWNDKVHLVEKIANFYLDEYNSFGDADYTNKLLHLQTVSTCAYRNFAYSQDAEITWTHPYFDWDFVYYVCNLPPKYKIAKSLFKEAFGDFISTIPWEYPKNGLSIPSKNKYRNN